MRVEVISHDTTRLLGEVADLRDEMNLRFEEVNQRFEEVNARFEEFDSKLSETRDAMLKEIRDGHATLLSAMCRVAGRTHSRKLTSSNPSPRCLAALNPWVRAASTLARSSSLAGR